MSRCARCSADLAAPTRFCPSCGAQVVSSSEIGTVAMASGFSSSVPDDGRFPPGTLLSQRYRITSRLGKGGMGEVYQAADLLIGQTVALKFLPESLVRDAAMTERFRGEVRLARQVSHPNICRVYDLGEAQGQLFLTMEFVDGEDLESLLRRIGRLPQDKALEIARKLCAGLAAAHEKGIVHRDLKPANIMLDGQGHIRIMDFGLAGLTGEIRDLRSGTPAYRAPEQKNGLEVTARSDIYSLGVLLHELLTGKRPGDSGRAEIDPAVDQVIQRCLAEDPRRRPASALAVAAALPGGDPLAAALAAGETPSPELVANSGETEGLRVPVAIACLAAVLVGIGAVCWVSQRKAFVNQLPMEYTPEVLAAKARDLAAGFGYTQRPLDRTYGWFNDTAYLDYARGRHEPADLKTNRPPALYFWYRESPRYLVDTNASAVTLEAPPGSAAG